MSWRRVLRDLLEEGWIKELRVRAAKMHGDAFKQYEFLNRLRQERCTHRKGGTIHSIKNVTSIGIALETGGSNDYAVMKHKFMNGDTWIRCIRCQRTWKPPIKPRWYQFWKMDQYFANLEEYAKALAFPTNNTTSEAIQVRFERNGKPAGGEIRAVLAES